MPLELVGSFDRPNLVYRVLPRATLKTQILDVARAPPRRGGHRLLHVAPRSRRAGGLAARARACARCPYHAGLSDDERSRNQDAFLNETRDVIVATVAFGMGIDRSDVRFVVHAGAPQSLEHYQQESGRAGRDGLEAECVLIYSARRLPEVARDARAQRRADRRARGRCCATSSATPRSVGCRHRHLVGYFGEPYAQDDCGACDYCLDELETGRRCRSSLARKILSCVARVGQRFGAAHVTNVLRGSDSEQVRRAGTTS